MKFFSILLCLLILTSNQAFSSSRSGAPLDSSLLANPHTTVSITDQDQSLALSSTVSETEKRKRIRKAFLLTTGTTIILAGVGVASWLFWQSHEDTKSEDLETRLNGPLMILAGTASGVAIIGLGIYVVGVSLGK